MNLDSFAYTSKGGRAGNEDFASCREEEGCGIYVVADGLGGHKDGEIASACVGSTLLELWAPVCSEDRGAWLYNSIGAANENVLELQRENQSNMKSTVVALAIDGDTAVWANTGDSRLYYLHGQKIADVTEDHSVAYKKYLAGQITRDQIGQDEDQSSLLCSVGSPDRWKPRMYGCPNALCAGDGFLLCSDGFWEYVYEQEILIDFVQSRTAQEWAEYLLLRVLDRVREGNDNISVVTVMIR